MLKCLEIREGACSEGNIERNLHQCGRAQVCTEANLHPGLPTHPQFVRRKCVLQNTTLFILRGEEIKSKRVHHNPPSCNLLDVLEDEGPERRLPQ